MTTRPSSYDSYGSSYPAASASFATTSSGSTKAALQTLYDEGKANQGVELDSTEAQKVVASLGINFGKYSDEVAKAITGLTKVEAFVYLMDLIASIDEHDGGSDDDTDFNLADGKNTEAAIGSIFDKMGLGSSEEAVGSKLETAAKEVFKDDNDSTDAEWIDTLKATQKGEKPENLTKELAGIMQLDNAFGVYDNTSSQSTPTQSISSQGTTAPLTVEDMFSIYIHRVENGEDAVEVMNELQSGTINPA